MKIQKEQILDYNTKGFQNHNENFDFLTNKLSKNGHKVETILSKLSELHSVFYKDVDYYTITVLIDGCKNNNLFDNIYDNIYKKQILYKPYNKNKWIYQERHFLDNVGPISL